VTVVVEPALAVLAVALAIDVVLGEPPTPVHPVAAYHRVAARSRSWLPARRSR
jgi:cobalamin biosynthesis protein CobD/CbiB